MILAWPSPGCNAGTLKELAPGVWQLRQLPPNVINVFLIEDVLVDAGTRHSGRRILRELRGREVGAHVLTHAHPDHQGSSAEVCERLAATTRPSGTRASS